MSTDLYFTASDLGIPSLSELWKLGPDGTLTAVTPLKTNAFDAASTAPYGIGQTRVFNGELYFAASSDANGAELYKVKSDGTVVQVADLRPGQSGSSPGALTVAGGALYFVTNSLAIYRVGEDGLPTLVSGVKNNLSSFRTFNGELYFQGDDGKTGPELWKIRTDGTAVQVADQNHGAEGSYPFFYGFGVAYHGEFYFSSAGPGGYELWKVQADGSEVRAADLNPSGSSNAGPLAVFNDELYISAQLPSGRELLKLKADGTSVDVASLEARNIGPVYEGALYFSALSAGTGLELWKITADGSVAQVADLNPGTGGSSPFGFTLFNGELYFRADAAGTSDYGLWKVKADGSVARVGDLATSDTSGLSLGVYNGELYFRASDGVHGEELFKLRADGTTVLVADVDTIAQGSNPSNYAALGSTLYFTATTNDHGTELWKVGGDGHAVLAADIRPGQTPPSSGGLGGGAALSSFPSNSMAYDGELYFYANKDYEGYGVGRELYKMKADGSIVLAADIRPGAGSSNTDRVVFATYRGELYFNAGDGTTGTELWKVKADGSVVQVKDIAEGSTSSITSYSLHFSEINGELYFNAKPFASAGYEAFLKVTADGSVVQANIYTQGPIIGYGPNTYFPASDGTTGTELFRQLPSVTGDGDVSRVVDLNPGSGSSNPTNFAAFAGAVYFSASDGTTGAELWRLGPGEVVSRVADINPGGGYSSPASLTAFDGALYFTATDGASGTELWKLAADGTVARAADIAPGAASSSAGSFFAAPHALYFTANDGATGTELWRVGEDGRVSLVADIEPGSGGSNPTGLTVLGERVYFTATTTKYGAEPWVIEADGSVHLVDDVNPANGSSVPANFILFTTADGAAPTVSITSSAATLSPTMPQATITFHFSAPPNGFDATDLVASGGTISALTAAAGDATTYTAVFTAENGFVGPASVMVAEGSYTYGGVAGHAGTASFAVEGAGSNAPNTPPADPGDDQPPVTAPPTVTDPPTANHAPVSAADVVTVAAHAVAAGSVLSNDGDPDGDALHVAAVRFAGGHDHAVPISGTTALTGEHGTLTIAADGQYSYVGALAGTDAFADRFTVTVADSHGATASSALVASVTAAALVSDATFAFDFASATLAYVGDEAILTGSDGVAHDVSGIGTLRFTDGTIVETDGAPLVDDLFYYSVNKDVWAAHLDARHYDADQHYAQYGWREGRDPDALFSTSGYLAANPDVKAAGIDPLQHYDTYGWHEGRTGGIGFSADAYLALNPDVTAAGLDPLGHYLQYGQAEGRMVLPGLSIAQGSGDHLFGDFDATFYLRVNTDVAAAAGTAGANPDTFALTHYLRYGAGEGRDPDAYFSTNGYLAANPDVAAAALNPLVHYELYGAKEGRAASGFDTNGYLAANPDVAAAHVDPLQHLLQYGMAEGRHGFEM